MGQAGSISLSQLLQLDTLRRHLIRGVCLLSDTVQSIIDIMSR